MNQPKRKLTKIARDYLLKLDGVTSVVDVGGKVVIHTSSRTEIFPKKVDFCPVELIYTDGEL